MPVATHPVPASSRVNGPARLVRGWLAAALITGLAGVSHALVAGADHAPSVLVWLFATVLAAPVCTAFAGRLLSLPRLLAAVLAGQAIFHALYAAAPLSAGHATAALPTAFGATPGTLGGAALHHAGHVGHAGHAVPGPGELAGVVLPAAELHHASGLSPAMLLAHLGAALLAAAVLHGGERLAVQIAQRALDGWIALRLLRWRPEAPLLTVRVTPAEPRALASVALSAGPGDRGPPVLTAAAA
ncbi:MAG: hypothetical protein Q4G34_02810 [Micrococcus sp.]|nr:hypothetical protein [Micrococcus sp.]